MIKDLEERELVTGISYKENRQCESLKTTVCLRSLRNSKDNSVAGVK